MPVGGGLSFLLSYFLVVRDVSAPVCRLSFRWRCLLIPDLSAGNPPNFQRRLFIRCAFGMPVDGWFSSVIEWLLVRPRDWLVVSFRSLWIRLPGAA
jgi:hypothetical protein